MAAAASLACPCPFCRKSARPPKSTAACRRARWRASRCPVRVGFRAGPRRPGGVGRGSYRPGLAFSILFLFSGLAGAARLPGGPADAGAAGPALRAARRREEHVRHWLLPPVQHGRDARLFPPRPPDHRRLPARPARAVHVRLAPAAGPGLGNGLTPLVAWPAMPWRGPSPLRARRSAGCATTSAWSSPRRTLRPWPAPSTGRTASSLCPPSRASSPRTGATTPAGPSSASRADGRAGWKIGLFFSAWGLNA